MKNRWGAKLGRPYGFWKSPAVIDLLDAVIEKVVPVEKARQKLEVSYDNLALHLWQRRKSRGDLMTAIQEEEENE